MNGDPTKVNPQDLRHDEKRPNLAEGPIADVSEMPGHPDGVYDRLRNTDPDGPVLVWKGKPAQDAEPLVVPTAPLVVQEHVTPEAILKGLPRKDGQIPLFDDGGELDEDKRYEAYQHEVDWKNRLILGDSLRVMQSLVEAENLRGQVQCIYIDPPYGVEFGSNWQPTTRKREVKDGLLIETTREPEVVQAFRDTWDQGVNSYLSYLRDRLMLANELLHETGSVFVQIGDENVHRVRAVLDDTFGPECRITTIVVKKKGAQKSGYLDPVNDYILWYSKNPRNGPEGAPKPKIRSLYERRGIDEESLDEFRTMELPTGETFPVGKLPDGEGDVFDGRENPRRVRALFPKARFFRAWPITNGGSRANQNDPVEFAGSLVYPPENNCWRHSSRAPEGQMSGMARVVAAGRALRTKSALDYKRYLDDFPYKTLSNWWDGLGGAAKPVYVVQTNEKIVERCLLMTTDPGDLVLDPTCGSGTTAVVSEQWGRRWITVDTSRVALTLARQRLMNLTLPWYVLADSDEGERVAEEEGLTALPGPHTGDLKLGFVYETAKRLISSSFARCEKIYAGIEKAEAESFACEYAEPVALYDQAVTDSKRVRVAGPFTVESLLQTEGAHAGHGGALKPSSTEEADLPRSETLAVEAVRREGEGGTFESRVIEFLMKDGIVNPDDKAAKICFDAVEPVGDPDLSATATYTDAQGRTVRAAVLIAPESRAVTKKDVRLAARAALQGIGHEALFVLAFGFEPDVAQGKQGEIFVYPVRLGHELQFGDKTLKKTGTGGLFTLFGDPDVAIETLSDGRLRAKLEGLDVYNPMTREAKSVGSGGDLSEDDGLDAVAAWFVDTAYDGTAFHVRQAYFLGGKNPYERLKKALRAEIDENAFDQLLGATGQPFPRPETGRVAVKVVNHYGDEAFRVLNV